MDGIQPAAGRASHSRTTPPTFGHIKFTSWDLFYKSVKYYRIAFLKLSVGIREDLCLDEKDVNERHILVCEIDERFITALIPLEYAPDYASFGCKVIRRIPNSDDSMLDQFGRCRFCKLDAHKKCRGCRRAWYCNAECQGKDWKTHKAICRGVDVKSERCDPIHNTRYAERDRLHI